MEDWDDRAKERLGGWDDRAKETGKVCADSRIAVQVVEAGDALSGEAAAASFSTFSPRAL